MLRSSVSKRFMATVSEAKPSKQWAQPSSGASSKSLKLNSKKFREALLEGVDPKQGPPSLKSRRFRIRYTSPAGINEAFDLAHDYLKKHAQEKYNQADKTQDPIEKSKLLVQAEINNPEVQYKFQYNDKYNNNTNIIDYTQPVYRSLKKTHWESYSQMLLMQRIEQHGVIQIHFQLWNQEPRFKNLMTLIHNLNFTQYSLLTQMFQMLRITHIRPIFNGGFQTLNSIIMIISSHPKRLLEDSSINEIIDYCPPTPEKNLPTQRFAIWVFRQSDQLTEKISNREFDIRKFVEEKKLQPIGAHLWRSAWDLNTPAVREKYGMPKGIVFHRVRGDERM
ncbi:putative odorant-binding protein A5 [Cyberlindnera fabianii]|uniref:Putative odorant-binding protein A5 n=1 Tax=Cyberlindnera fabianii TaxID=36022 RepID=A0A1V2KZG7_CYBFA|nr:putative odorant-binding protein A5 [Cyberlindnera fabianii]